MSSDRHAARLRLKSGRARLSEAHLPKPLPEVHGLWIGARLSRLELLTIRSFLNHGHRFNLWLYDDLATPLPSGTQVRDAASIVPAARIFRKRDADAASGVGQGSYGPFSDLFRYKLLHDVGGIWVDMDVTCLRPFDFEQPYVFRAHRIGGVVGNLIRAPRGAKVMASAYEMADAVANEDVPWMTLNRMLSAAVHEADLQSFIRADLLNDQSPRETIAAFVGGRSQPKDTWYGIHWGNEYWNTVRGGDNNASIAPVPSKDDPPPGTLLRELYRSNGIIDPRAPETSSSPSADGRRGRHSNDARALPSGAALGAPLCMLVPSLARGGAERIVIDIAEALSAYPESRVELFVKAQTLPEHKVLRAPNLKVVYLDRERMDLRQLGAHLAELGVSTLFTHLINSRDLEILWKNGILTVPVVHNSAAGWKEPATIFNARNVPFVVACADAVKRELEEGGCIRPVSTIRHESRLRPEVEKLRESRRSIRAEWGVSNDTLVIGMVGQFKTQKAYTRAIRVLHGVQQFVQAKLVIVGGWNHPYGAGRVAYEAAMRLAVELGVVADVVIVGEVAHAEPYLAAFDVFLNTSLYEGLSVSVLEARACGCPVVMTSVGGAAEIPGPNIALVEDGTDIGEFVEAILNVASDEVRAVPSSPTEPALVPNLWLGLGVAASRLTFDGYPERNGTLFLTDGLHLGGPASSLERLLKSDVAGGRLAVVCARGVSLPGVVSELEAIGVKVFGGAHGEDPSRLALRIVAIIAAENYKTLCMWNAQPELKLLLAKLLRHTEVRICDVSPGPMLFDELAHTEDYQRRIAFSEDDYFASLHTFVSLYAGGKPRHPTRSVKVLPLGVPLPPRYVAMPPPQLIPPADWDPAFALGTVCRIVPEKQLELLLEAVELVAKEHPAVNLTIVGSPDQASGEYATKILARARELSRCRVRFTGGYSDVNRLLALWRVFLLSGNRQGFPNASLEAMAMSLPVVAFDSGGVRDQIVDTKTGYVVTSPVQMAEKIILLLGDRALSGKLGRAGRARVERKFTIRQSAAEFARVLNL